MKHRVKVRITGLDGWERKFSFNLKDEDQFILNKDSPGFGLTHASVGDLSCVFWVQGGKLFASNPANASTMSWNGNSFETVSAKKGDLLKMGVYQLEFLDLPQAAASPESEARTQFIDVGGGTEPAADVTRESFAAAPAPESMQEPEPMHEPQAQAPAPVAAAAIVPAPEPMKMETAPAPAAMKMEPMPAPARAQALEEEEPPYADEEPAPQPTLLAQGKSSAPALAAANEALPEPPRDTAPPEPEKPSFMDRMRPMFGKMDWRILAGVGASAAAMACASLITYKISNSRLAGVQEELLQAQAEAVAAKKSAAEARRQSQDGIKAMEQLKADYQAQSMALADAKAKLEELAKAPPPKPEPVAVVAPPAPKKKSNPIDAYMTAAQDGEVDEIKLLLKNKKVAIDAKSKAGFTALHMAAKAGQLDVAKYLVSRKASIDAKDAKGNTALMLAVAGKHKSMVSFLMSKHASTKTKRKDGKRAVDIAKALKLKEYVAMLDGKGGRQPASEKKASKKASKKSAKKKKTKRHSDDE